MRVGTKVGSTLFRSFITTAAPLLSGAIAHAQEASVSEDPVPLLDATFSSANPNLNEWTLINLTPTDVASALDGAGTKVAVLDGKADCTHAALSGRCVNYGLSGATYTSYNAHGTHVSGIVGANPYGIAPGVDILNFGVFADSGWVATGTKLSDTWKAALAAGAHISSMSFGCTRKALCFSASDLATMASSNTTMLFVKAAGNDGSTLLNESTSANYATALAALNKTLIVGSVNSSGVISGFSNRPSDTCLLPSGATACSDDLRWRNHFLVAPGEAIYSTTPNNTYGSWSGTSMATPVVAGVAALLQERWPALKDSPETLAAILLTSATDLGEPGVDDVYGYGLLNATKAFMASGTVTVVPITEPSPPPDGGATDSTTTSKGKGKSTTRTPRGKQKSKSISVSSFSGFAEAIGSVTVYDAFGRDFRYDETDQFDVQQDVNRQRGIRSRRLLGALTQESWAPAFFASEPEAHSFGAFGSTLTAPGVDDPYDQALRLGADLPLGRTAVQLRLTGPGDPRADLSYDPSLRPLAFFPSTSLATNSFITNVLLPAGKKARFMVYGLTSVQPIEAELDESTRNSLHGRHLTSLRAQISGETSRKQSGIGVGYWRKVGEGMIVGLNASAMTQRNGFLGMTSDIDAFEKPTHLFNLGIAVSYAAGKWDFSASTEFTHARMTASNYAIGITPTTTASADVTFSRRGILTDGRETSDSLRTSIILPPRAISGSLKLEYMGPTADGLDRQATIRHIAMSSLGHDPVRLEAAYQIRSGDRWSLSVSGGVDLEKVNGSRSTEALVSFNMKL